MKLKRQRSGMGLSSADLKAKDEGNGREASSKGQEQ